jgi:glutamate racemase
MDKDNNKDISKNIDVITLSSSHLPFVKNYLTALMPTINFVDPSRSVAVEVKKFLISNRMLKKNGKANLLVLVSAEKRHFEKIIHAMGIKEYVTEVDLTF